MSNVNINIAAEFKGKKAFKEATTSTDKLTKNVKGLAKSLLAVYSAQKILSFAKQSVKAFAEDDKAAKALGTTLKNLGLAYGSNVGTVNGFISRLEMQTGVLDDELRPAMDRLLRATGDVTKSQELLGLALDIAAGTGKSLTQVSQSLQKAYLGQTQALGRLGVGLTKAELTSSSFEQIQERLNVLFAGQAVAAADSYAGSLAKLTVAGNNAKETIGKGLVDAFVTITNSSSVDDLITKIDAAAESIANFVRETGEFIKITKSIFDFDLFAPNRSGFQGMGNISISKSSQDTQKADAAAKKAAANQIKATNALTKSQKDQAKLAKARAIFDLQKIQIEAALKGKLSEEDRLRLLLMKAIENENISDIEKYTKLLTEAQTKAKELQDILDKIQTTKMEDPFAGWKTSAGNTVEAINEVTKAMFAVQTQIQANGREWSSFANLIANTIIQPNLKEFSSPFAPNATNPAKIIPTPPNVPSNEPVGSDQAVGGGSASRGGGRDMMQPLSINVNVGGTVVSEGNLIDAITNAIYQQQKNGKAIVYNSTSI